MNRKQLATEARKLASLLKSSDQKVVFAESCTAGLVSAVLAEVPGASEHHCGSAVVYRIETKAQWLGVSRDVLDNPGPVSRVVAEQMARGVLDKTPEADLSASVTGHLGPGAPPNQDGLIYIGLAQRARRGEAAPPRTVVHKRWLTKEMPAGGSSGSAAQGRQLRIRRQIAAAHLVLSLVCSVLEKQARPRSRRT